MLPALHNGNYFGLQTFLLQMSEKVFRRCRFYSVSALRVFAPSFGGTLGLPFISSLVFSPPKVSDTGLCMTFFPSFLLSYLS